MLAIWSALLWLSLLKKCNVILLLKYCAQHIDILRRTRTANAVLSAISREIWCGAVYLHSHNSHTHASNHWQNRTLLDIVSYLHILSVNIELIENIQWSIKSMPAIFPVKRGQHTDIHVLCAHICARKNLPKYHWRCGVISGWRLSLFSLRRHRACASTRCVGFKCLNEWLNYM